ncbi:imidazole glycerol phosphate synthase subunit HisF [Thalassospira povalilytica]|uniref:imidazole glycerol phosphate synthase subunit HisF n=1 Tax=Thalassospira povalilytica TaxID=732237 RepID=UPI003AA983E8
MSGRKFRVISRLDIKGRKLIKGIHLEGLRVVGDPQVFAEKYYLDGIDELIYMDSVASLYGRNNLRDVVKHTANNIFVPMTVGGGIRSVADIEELLNAGADKVAINTAAINNPNLIREAASTFGSQCIVLSVEAKKAGPSNWEAYTDNGREKTGVDVYDWVKKAEDLGVGEILVTSVDNEGTGRGFDIALTKLIASSVDVPVIASGGMGKLEHVTSVCNEGFADAVAIAGAFHYEKVTIGDVRDTARAAGVSVRTF